MIPVFAAPGDTPEARAAIVQRCRTQIAFYGSTKNYAFQFDDLGFDGTSARLNERLKAGDIAGMAELITDDMLDHFAVVCRWDELADTWLRTSATRLIATRRERRSIVYTAAGEASRASRTRRHARPRGREVARARDAQRA